MIPRKATAATGSRKSPERRASQMSGTAVEIPGSGDPGHAVTDRKVLHFFRVVFFIGVQVYAGQFIMIPAVDDL